MSECLSFVYVIYIVGAVERVWHVLIDVDFIVGYWGYSNVLDWYVGFWWEY